MGQQAVPFTTICQKIMAKPQISEANSAPWSCAKHRGFLFFCFFSTKQQPAYEPSSNLANSLGTNGRLST